MLGISKVIGSGLKADVNIAAVFGDKVYPMFAPNKTKGSYIIFKVQQVGSVSKDGIVAYNIIIWNYAKNYDISLQQAALVSAALQEINYVARVWNFIEGAKDPQITEDYESYVEHLYSITTYSDVVAPEKMSIESID